MKFLFLCVISFLILSFWRKLCGAISMFVLSFLIFLSLLTSVISNYYFQNWVNSIRLFHHFRDYIFGNSAAKFDFCTVISDSFFQISYLMPRYNFCVSILYKEACIFNLRYCQQETFFHYSRILFIYSLLLCNL